MRRRRAARSRSLGLCGGAAPLEAAASLCGGAAPLEAAASLCGGQRVELDNAAASTVSFLGLATNGPSAGTATVQYTDGTTQQVPVSFGDWAGTAPAGNTALVTVAGRNNVNGTAGDGTFRVFATQPVALDPAKVVDAVILPQGSDKGMMHIFDVAVS